MADKEVESLDDGTPPKRGRPRKVVDNTEAREVAPDVTAMVSALPSGPYTVWVRREGADVWRPRDFATLEGAVGWDRDGVRDYVIMKPVRYAVHEIGAGFVYSSRDDVTPEEVVDIGPPPEPGNPDSGDGRWV